MQESQFGSKVYLFFDEVNTTTMGMSEMDGCLRGSNSLSVSTDFHF
mgnify:CR=1 FL=1